MIEMPASVEVVWPMVAAALLALARPLGLASTAPGWASAAIGPRVRLMIGVALAVLVFPLVPEPSGSKTDLGSWVGLIVIELAVGAGLGLTGALVVSGARQAGELVGMQAGLSPASVLDPESPATGVGEPDDPLTPLGHLYGMIALAVFLALDGPLRLVDALAASYRAVPPGIGLIGGSSGTGGEAIGALVPDLFGRIGRALGLALRAAAPAGLGTLMAGLALAVLARTAGARPLSGLGWPVRAAVGIGLVLVTLGVLGATLTAAWTRWVAEFAGG